jgi:hypothetical protein
MEVRVVPHISDNAALVIFSFKRVAFAFLLQRDHSLLFYATLVFSLLV